MPTENQEDNFLKLAMNYLSDKSKYPIIGEIKYKLGIWMFFSKEICFSNTICFTLVKILKNKNMKKQIKKASPIVILCLFMLMAIASGQEEKEKEKEVEEKTKTEVAIPVKSSVLYEAYEANEVAADQKYKDKVLEISGKVISIDKSLGDIIVALNGLIDNEYEIMGIRCRFDASHAAEAASLSKGQSIKIKGICEGTILGVNISGCSLVK